jgi:hypothetical protein
MLGSQSTTKLLENYVIKLCPTSNILDSRTGIGTSLDEIL